MEQNVQRPLFPRAPWHALPGHSHTLHKLQQDLEEYGRAGSVSMSYRDCHNVIVLMSCDSCWMLNLEQCNASDKGAWRRNGIAQLCLFN